MEEQRSSQREPASEELTFNVTIYDRFETKSVEAKAKVINKSEKGLCLVTSVSLEPGHVLIIDNREVGLVKWSKREDSHYIAGVLRKGKIHGLPKG
mgnify:CR=1 FL=1